MTLPAAMRIALPDWVPALLADAPVCRTDEEKMALVIRLSRENIEREPGGGPFGAAVFPVGEGRPVAVGVNSVIRLRNSALHAEVLALMLAHEAVGAHSFALPEAPRLELVTSCEPCAMCLGAALWSGVRRIVCGAAKEDAEALGFDEGPVTDESYRHLAGRGVEVRRGVARAEARAVLQRYRELGRPVY